MKNLNINATKIVFYCIVCRVNQNKLSMQHGRIIVHRKHSSTQEVTLFHTDRP